MNVNIWLPYRFVYSFDDGIKVKLVFNVVEMFPVDKYVNSFRYQI